MGHLQRSKFTQHQKHFDKVCSKYCQILNKAFEKHFWNFAQVAKIHQTGHTASICQNINVFCNFLVSLPSKFYNIYARYEIFSLNRIFESLDVIRVKIRFFAKKTSSPSLAPFYNLASARPNDWENNSKIFSLSKWKKSPKWMCLNPLSLLCSIFI